MIQEHGGNIYRYNGVLDFSANINPSGMPDEILKAVISSAENWKNYPDPECSHLREILSYKLNIPAENIVCGNGADDLIFRLVHCMHPRRAAVCVPSFSEYIKALEEAGCEIREFCLKEENDFRLTDDFISLLNDDTDIAVLCTPNNPTGQLISPELLRETAMHCEAKGITLLCDESFMEFTGAPETYSLLGSLNTCCVVLSSLTKIYAIPGLRLGYAVCGSRDTAMRLFNSGQYWSVSVPAQAAGCAALECDGFVSESRDLIRREREYLTEVIGRFCEKVYPSAANYLLFKAAPGLDRRLLEKGILIRSCENYKGLGKHFFRTAVRTHSENMRLAQALAETENEKRTLQD